MILIVSMVFLAISDDLPNRILGEQTDHGMSVIQENFENLFYLIGNKSSSAQTYRNALKQEVVRKKQVFDEAKDEIQRARIARINHHRNFIKMKRQIPTTPRIMSGKTETTQYDITARLTTESDTDFRATSKDKIIVDKTKFIPTLLDCGMKGRRQFIILRPYRFGKSFFLTTLAAFFEGNEDIFCNRPYGKMDICDAGYNFEAYPVLFMSFNEAPRGSLLDFIKTRTLILAQENKISDINVNSDFAYVMSSAFERIYQKTKKKVVILVDEYDNHVMKEFFHDAASTRNAEDEIGCFFSAMKNNANYIHFTFVMGATKITTTGETQSLLKDLSQDEAFGELIGFTEEEVKKYYVDQIEEIARKRKLENGDKLFEEVLKPYYNHHRFTKNSNPLFNPISVTTFLRENPENLMSYWGEIVTHRILLRNTVMKFSKTALDIVCDEPVPVTLNHLKERIDRERIEAGDSKELAKILFQAGFLTVVEDKECTVGTPSSLYLLGVVNREAKEILEMTLREKMNDGPATLKQMEALLEARKLGEFISVLDKAIEFFTGDKFYIIETKYTRVIGFLLEVKQFTWDGALEAFQNSMLNTEYKYEGKFIDYIKKLPSVTIMYYLKKQNTGTEYIDCIEESMKCLGTYMKPYGRKYDNETILCIIISMVPTTKDGEQPEKIIKKRPTRGKFIHNWAAVEWHPKIEELKTYNLGLEGSDERTQHRLKVIKKYDETDQRIEPSYLIPASFDPIAQQIFQQGTGKKVLSLEQFYDFVESCSKTLKDARKTEFIQLVSKFTDNKEGLINLIEECRKQVPYQTERQLFYLLTKIIKALRELAR